MGNAFKGNAFMGKSRLDSRSPGAIYTHGVAPRFGKKHNADDRRSTSRA
jgi:hypothetical protein